MSSPDRGPVVFAVTTATLVLASVFVAARMICRFFIVRKISWDDKVMLLAWLIAFFLSFTIDLGVRNGLGRHDQDIPQHERPTLRRCEYVFSILYNPALMATKSSILIFYLRLAKNTQVVLRYASFATLAVVLLAGTVLTLMNIFQCSPVAAGWSPDYDSHAKCIPLLTEFICAAPVNIITDLAILALPIPVLTGMRLPLRQKTILVLTFTFGVFVTIVDVVRIYYLQRAITHVPTGSSDDPNSRFGEQANFAWNASMSLMWSAVEVNVGMACACVPTLKPLFLKLMPSMLYDPDGTKMTASRIHSDSDTPTSHGNGAGNIARPAPAAVASGQQHQREGSGDSEQMTFTDFLTTPEMRTGSDGANSGRMGSASGRGGTNRTMSTGGTLGGHSLNEDGVYFGFVNMSKPKSMLKTTNAESLKYCIVVSILFLLWGISYGLLNTLNNVVASVNHMSTAQTLGLTSVYWGGGYFFGPILVGEWILRRDEHNRTKRHQRDQAESVGGFKVTFQTGLAIYGIGTIIFWPSAVTNSYGGFMLSNFIVGFGLSVLEVGANAFMILCGPPEHGETRLLLAQGVQGIGSVLSGVLADKVFFTNLTQNQSDNSLTLINVQWTYLGITLLCVILNLFFYYMPLPEVSDQELQEAAEQLPLDPHKKSFFGLQLRTVGLILAVLTQYMYVASQETNSTFFRSLLISILPNQSTSGTGAASGSTSAGNSDQPDGISLSISDYLLIAHTAFAVSRFLVAYLTYLSVSHPRMPKPRTYLTISIVLCFIFALLPVVIKTPDPDLLVIPIILFFFAEGPIWPLVFAIGLRGQGRRTKRAAAFITMGASGAAWAPFLMYGIIVSGGTVQMAFIMIVVMSFIMLFYPAFLEGSKDARRLLDPCVTQRIARSDDEEPAIDEVVANRVRHNAATSEKKTGVLDKLARGFHGRPRRPSPVLEYEHNEGAANENRHTTQ